MTLRPDQVIGQMQAILSAAQTACNDDPRAMVAGLIGALVITCSMAGQLDGLLKISIDSLEATREMNRLASSSSTPAAAGKGLPS